MSTWSTSWAAYVNSRAHVLMTCSDPTAWETDFVLTLFDSSVFPVHTFWSFCIFLSPSRLRVAYAMVALVAGVPGVGTIPPAPSVADNIAGSESQMPGVSEFVASVWFAFCVCTCRLSKQLRGCGWQISSSQRGATTLRHALATDLTRDLRHRGTGPLEPLFVSCCSSFKDAAFTPWIPQEFYRE